MRYRKNICLLLVFMAVLATFMVWTIPVAAARGQHALAGQSPASPHWNTWRVVKSPSPGSNLNVLNGVAVLSAKDEWAVGNYYKKNKPQPTLIEHWNGSQWSIVTSPNPGAGYNVLNGVVALSAKNIWAVGYYTKDDGADQTLIEHWNGSQWSVVTSPNPTSFLNALSGVAALSARDVWAVGHYSDGRTSKTLTEHWDGSRWSVIASANLSDRNSLIGVAALAQGKVWAVGNYYNGSGISQTLIELYS